MAVSQESQGCVFDDETYSEGSEICELMGCIICKNGKWENAGNLWARRLDVAALLQGHASCLNVFIASSTSR